VVSSSRGVSHSSAGVGKSTSGLVPLLGQASNDSTSGIMLIQRLRELLTSLQRTNETISSSIWVTQRIGNATAATKRRKGDSQTTPYGFQLLLESVRLEHQRVPLILQNLQQRRDASRGGRTRLYNLVDCRRLAAISAKSIPFTVMRSVAARVSPVAGSL
jgi:hypothetical protein